MAEDAREARVRERAAEEGPVRRRVVSICTAAAADWHHAPERIARGLRGARELNSAERRFVADAVHELVRFRRRLAAAAGSEQADKLLDAWLRRDLALDENLATRTSYPDWLVTRLSEQYPDQAPSLLEAMNQRAPLTVRANRVKCDRDQLARRLESEGIPCAPTRLAHDGLVLATRRNVYEMAAFREGWMELQDEGSQLIAELCAPPPSGTVIDACAGAGGKTLALAALLQNRGRVVAYDISGTKLTELRRRVRRAGLTNVQALAVERGPPGGATPADRLLVDAPCSGTGVIRRNPETKWRLHAEEIDELCAKQKAILAAYAPLVRTGGRLIYATCSLLHEENDGIVDAFLSAHGEFESVPTKEILGKEHALQIGDGERLRLWPHLHDTDGFFAAVLRRR